MALLRTDAEHHKYTISFKRVKRIKKEIGETYMYDLYTAMMIIWSGEWVRESARKRIFLQLKIVYDFNLENKSGMQNLLLKIASSSFF